jgi:hypothetical protein
MRVIEDSRCKAIAKDEYGYRVNGNRILAIKYSTKAHSPWGFTFSNDDIQRFNAARSEFGECLLALVCGGDGVCALSWTVAAALLANKPGCIAAKRGFAGCYGVNGPSGQLKSKVAMNQWPAVVFDDAT